MEVIKHHEVIYGNELDLSEYFYFFRKLWRDMERRIRENEFKDFEERMIYRRLWLNEKEKVLRENARVSSHFLEHITLQCDKKLNSGLPSAILFVQDIPTAACVFGNGVV